MVDRETLKLVRESMKVLINDYAVRSAHKRVAAAEQRLVMEVIAHDPKRKRGDLKGLRPYHAAMKRAQEYDAIADDLDLRIAGVQDAMARVFHMEQGSPKNLAPVPRPIPVTT